MRKHLLYFFLPCCLVACSDTDPGTTLDRVPLQQQVATADSLLDHTQEGADLGQYVQGSKIILRKAKEEAAYVLASTDRQSAIGHYAQKLGGAIADYRSSVVAAACPSFDGKGYINCGAAEPFCPVNITIQAKVLYTKSGGDCYIAATEGWSNQAYGYVLRVDTGGKALDFTVALDGSWCAAKSQPGSFEPGVWYDVSASYDGEHIRLYVDGVLVAETFKKGSISSGTAPLYIGEGPSWGGRQFKGQLRALRFWDHARSLVQVQADRLQQPAPDASGLLAYWPFDVNRGRQVLDLTGRHYANLEEGVSWKPF